MMQIHGEKSSDLSAVGNVRRTSAAFTLIEVMIASGILFICLFAMLGVLANALRNARALQRHNVDAGMLAAELSLTNKLEEGSDSGDFGDTYPDYRWTRQIYEVASNGLFEVDYSVFDNHSTSDKPESQTSVLFFRPDSPMRPGAPILR